MSKTYDYMVKKKKACQSQDSCKIKAFFSAFVLYQTFKWARAVTRRFRFFFATVHLLITHRDSVSTHKAAGDQNKTWGQTTISLSEKAVVSEPCFLPHYHMT